MALFTRKNRKLEFRRDLVFGTSEVPLMVFTRYEIKGIENQIERARAELGRDLAKSDDSSRTWGYFPQLCDEKGYPECAGLGSDLLKHFSYPENLMSLAFVRLADGVPISDFGGMHVDVGAGVAHERNDSRDILRLILNLGENPRTLEYVPATKSHLREFGFDIPENKYSALSFPSSVPRKRIEIPPREKDRIYGLKFWASQVPHSGITDKRGHFVAAFGGYFDMNEVRI